MSMSPQLQIYRGRGIYWVIGSVPVLLKIAPQRGESRERKNCKFQNEVHRTFDPRMDFYLIFLYRVGRKN